MTEPRDDFLRTIIAELEAENVRLKQEREIQRDDWNAIGHLEHMEPPRLAR